MKHFSLILASLLLLTAAIVVPRRAFAAGAGNTIAGYNLMLTKQATGDVAILGVHTFGPHTQSTYGAAVSFLLHSTDAPIIVRFLKHRRAIDELGFVEYREATGAKVTVNGVEYTEDFDDLNGTAIRQVILFPPHGGWLDQSLSVGVEVFDGHTNPDGSPHTIFDTYFGDFIVNIP
jgi:hypothetical protein